MKKSAICIDDWKLPVFSAELSKAGFEFEQHPGIMAGTLTMIVLTETIAELQPVVVAANNRAAREKGRLAASRSDDE